jgi:transposase
VSDIVDRHVVALAAEARAAGLRIMVGCMVATSLAMAPALLLAQDADWVDLDGPLLLARDRQPGLTYEGALVHPPVVEERRVCTDFRDIGARCRQRVHDARCNHRARPSAQRRRPKKDCADQAIGRSRGGLTTKIHAVVDALGNPVALSITPGQAADMTQAVPLIDEVEPEAIIADKGYDSDALVDTLEERGITPVIPSKANRKEPRKTDFALYRERRYRAIEGVAAIASAADLRALKASLPSQPRQPGGDDQSIPVKPRWPRRRRRT